MTPLFTLKIITGFAAAHTLHGYAGNCASMRGYNWKVEATEVDEIDMGIDFHLLKKAQMILTLDLIIIIYTIYNHLRKSTIQQKKWSLIFFVN